MACEFSSGLLPYIKIVLSPPASPRLCKNWTSSGSLAGPRDLVVILVVGFSEVGGERRAKDNPVHSYTT